MTTLTQVEIAAIKEAAQRACTPMDTVALMQATSAFWEDPNRIVALCEAWEALHKLVECERADTLLDFIIGSEEAWQRARALIGAEEG